jgi:hypothetical protein
MDYFVRRGSDYSEVVLELIEDGHTDSESFFRDLQSPGTTITFTMVDADTDKPVFVEGITDFKCNGDGEPCQIYHKFGPEEVRVSGTYIAKFKIKFGDGDKLLIPIREDLKIHVIK